MDNVFGTIYEELVDQILDGEYVSRGTLADRNERTRATRRKNSVKKAIRKKNISLHYGVDAMEWYCNPRYHGSIHPYSKGKVHCSCPLCADPGYERNRERKKIQLAIKEAGLEMSA